jgi:hypothetical protein
MTMAATCRRKLKRKTYNLSLLQLQQKRGTGLDLGYSIANTSDRKIIKKTEAGEGSAFYDPVPGEIK